MKVKLYFRSLLYMSVFAALTIFLMDTFLLNILFTVCRALLKDLYFLLYAPLALLIISALMILSWRLYRLRTEAQTKREFLLATEGQDFDRKTVRTMRRHDRDHRAILIAALTVSLIESLLIHLPFLFPFQFVLFWLSENYYYMKDRREWMEGRLHR